MILLDTNVVLWMLSGHPRAARLLETESRLFLSPVTLLELRFLVEVGKVEEVSGRSVADLRDDPRWELDNPTSEALFRTALPMDWTRDPFDRLLAAHAAHRRWRLATGNRHLFEHLGAERAVAF